MLLCQKMFLSASWRLSFIERVQKRHSNNTYDCLRILLNTYHREALALCLSYILCRTLIVHDPSCYSLSLVFYYVRGSVHRKWILIIVQQDATIYSLLYFCKLLYMFRVVTPHIIRSTYNCNYSIWLWSNRLCYLPLWWRSWNFCCIYIQFIVFL